MINFYEKPSVLSRFLILLYLDLKDLKYYTHFSIDLREQQNIWNSANLFSVDLREQKNVEFYKVRIYKQSTK